LSPPTHLITDIDTTMQIYELYKVEVDLYIPVLLYKVENPN